MAALGAALALAAGPFLGVVPATAAVDDTDATASESAAAEVVAPAADQLSVDGDLRVGGTASVDPRPDLWQPTEGLTFSQQWYADGQILDGEVDPSLDLTAELQGATLSVEVTGTLAATQDSPESSDSVTVVAGGEVAEGELATGSPSISGTVRVGSKVTANPGTWGSGTSLSYQWQADGTTISGATNKTFTPQAGHKGKVLTVRVTGTKPGYATVARTSAGKTVLAGVFTSAPRPKIAGLVEGRAKIGKTVTAQPLATRWSPRPTTFKYQWKADGRAIRGATSSTYTPKGAQHGKTLTVTVKGIKSGYTTKAVTSAGAVVSKPYTRAPRPTISGTVRVGSTLTASHGTWDPKPRSFAYQWFVDGERVAGATSRTFTIRKVDHGKRVKVQVTAKKHAYLITRRTSDATVAVRWPVGVTVPRITSHPQHVVVTTGTTVSFTASAKGGRLQYQWQKRTVESGKWVDVAGKTSPTLRFTARSNNTLTEYRLRAKNVAGTRYSKAAVLWVDSTRAEPYNPDKIFATWDWVAAIGKSGSEPWNGKTLMYAPVVVCNAGDSTEHPASVLDVVYQGSGGRSYGAGGYSFDDDIWSAPTLASGECADFWAYAVVPNSATSGGTWRFTETWTNDKQWVRAV